MENTQGFGDEASTLEQLRRYGEKIAQLESELAQADQERHRLRAHCSGLNRELQQLLVEKAELDQVFEYALDLFCAIDPAGEPVRVNPACANLLGYSQQEFLQIPIDNLVHPDDVMAVHENMSAVIAGRHSVNFETRLQHKNGQWRWFSWTCPGRIAGSQLIYSIARDVTDSRTTAQALLYQAQHDPLTGLGNRALFDQSLSDAISRAMRLPEIQVALMLFDLDGFKAINDSLGHDAGDRVLQVVAGRLIQRKREAEVICRLGGDEFAWILESRSPLDADKLAATVLAEVCQPIELENGVVHVGCSIGISRFPDLACNAESLTKQADEAMYQVKRTGKMSYAWYAATRA
jgi:diguanylate cyclase (GGDEF)-like protein/PAS domain S-box-containing protein